MDPSDDPITPPNPKINDIQRVGSKISEIVVNGIDQFLTRKSMNPGLVFTPASAHLGDDHQAIRIGMKRLLNDLIRNMRTVKVLAHAVQGHRGAREREAAAKVHLFHHSVSPLSVVIVLTCD